MNIKDITFIFSEEREFNELMESFIIPELKKYRVFIDSYLLPSATSLNNKKQKPTDAYSFYVKTTFEEYRALIFKENNRWFVCRANRFYNSDSFDYKFFPRDEERDFDYFKINNRYVYYPYTIPHSLLYVYQNNPVYVDSLLEDRLFDDVYLYLKYQGYRELLKIRHNYEPVYKPLPPLKVSLATGAVDSKESTQTFSKRKSNPYDPLKEVLRFIVNNKNLIPSPDLNGVYLFNELEFSNIEDLIDYLAKEIHLKNLAYKMKARGLTQYDFAITLSPEDISTILKNINKGDNENENTKEEANTAERTDTNHESKGEY